MSTKVEGGSGPSFESVQVQKPKVDTNSFVAINPNSLNVNADPEVHETPKHQEHTGGKKEDLGAMIHGANDGMSELASGGHIDESHAEHGNSFLGDTIHTLEHGSHAVHANITAPLEIVEKTAIGASKLTQGSTLNAIMETAEVVEHGQMAKVLMKGGEHAHHGAELLEGATLGSKAVGTAMTGLKIAGGATSVVGLGINVYKGYEAYQEGNTKEVARETFKAGLNGVAIASTVGALGTGGTSLLVTGACVGLSLIADTKAFDVAYDIASKAKDTASQAVASISNAFKSDTPQKPVQTMLASN
jgi:hypothetical protein